MGWGIPRACPKRGNDSLNANVDKNLLSDCNTLKNLFLFKNDLTRNSIRQF